MYSFYRQGQSFRIPVHCIDSPKNADKPQYIDQQLEDNRNSKITVMDKRISNLGQMYLINEKVLVARSSSKILFFKLQRKEDLAGEMKTEWQLYHDIPIRGMIFFIKGNKRFQITNDKKIYFYLIDTNTKDMMPQLENVMKNFMNCSQMMFGSMVKYCITYKTN